MYTDINNLIDEIYKLKLDKESLEDIIKDKKSQINIIEAQINTKSEELLEKLNTAKLNYIENTNLVAASFNKNSIEYTNDNDVMKMLKDYGYDKLVRTKTTESLDKNAIKKAMKTDTKLTNLLENYTTTKSTQYVVVTSKSNYEKMLEHIEE